MHLHTDITQYGECAADTLCLDELFPILPIAKRGVEGFAVHEWNTHSQCYQSLPTWHMTEASARREREQILGLLEAA